MPYGARAKGDDPSIERSIDRSFRKRARAHESRRAAAASATQSSGSKILVTTTCPIDLRSKHLYAKPTHPGVLYIIRTPSDARKSCFAWETRSVAERIANAPLDAPRVDDDANAPA